MHMTSKELSYLSDSMRNEELLMKLCVHAETENRNTQLGPFFMHLAEVRWEHYNQLLGMLENKAGASQFLHQ